MTFRTSDRSLMFFVFTPILALVFGFYRNRFITVPLGCPFVTIEHTSMLAVIGLPVAAVLSSQMPVRCSVSCHYFFSFLIVTVEIKQQMA